MARLLGGNSPKNSDHAKSRDIELGDSSDAKPLLGYSRGSQDPAPALGISASGKGCCRENISRLFGSGRNAQFADDAELAVRAAFFVVVVGLPFLLPRHVVPTLDFFMKAGVYTNSVVIFFIYNLYKTTGETIMNVVAGLRGTFLAVANTWMMYYIFPDGVSDTTPDYVFWAGIANGVLFISTMLLLNWQMSTTIFAVSNFVFFWMSFLQPGEDRFDCPFTEQFQFLGNAGINSLITVGVGGVFCVMVTFFPYPRWAQFKAQDTAKELVHHLPLLWKTFAEFFCEAERNDFHGDQIHRRLERLSRLASTMGGHIGNSWYECFGRRKWHQVRRTLAALEKMIHESYDRIYCTYSVASTEQWSVVHAELMQRVKPSMMATITEAEVLLQVCFQCAFDGELTKVEEIAIEKACASVRKLEAEFTKAFTSARQELARDKSRCMDELLPEHIFGLNFSSFVRMALGFAEDLIQQQHNPAHLPPVTEIASISSLWDKAVVLDPVHLNWVLRAAASIFTGFAIGFFGFSDISGSYNAGIACTASVLLSKFVGSAMVKNLGRIQGVVLGSVIGQLAHALLGSCEAWGVTAMAACLFLYATTTLFTYYNSTQYSYIACLLAANGCGQMLIGGCGMHGLDKASSYDTIISTICAIGLVMVYDMVVPPGRASDKAHQGMGKAVNLLDTALSRHFDADVTHVRFHKGDLHSAVADAESMGKEAFQEPRYWRTPWKDAVFTSAINITYRIRYSLAAMEYAMAEGFQDGGRKNSTMRMLMDTPSCARMLEVMKTKVTAVRPLVEFFAHETDDRFPGLSHPKATHTFRTEMREASRGLLREVAKNPRMAQAGESTLEEDPLCQVCMLMGAVNSIMAGLRELQHAILRGE